MPKLIPGAGEKPKKWGKKKIVAAAAVLLIVLLVGGYFAYNQYNSSRPTGSADRVIVQSPVTSAATDQAITQANDKIDAGDTDGAVAVLDTAVANSTATYDKATLLSVKATTLANAGRTDDGVAAARQAIALTPHNPTLYLTLGSIYDIAGQTDKAVAVYKEGIANLSPGPYHDDQQAKLNTAIAKAGND